MNDEQWDDYITRREGTHFGDLARNYDKQFTRPPTNYYIPKKQVPAKPAQPAKPEQPVKSAPPAAPVDGYTGSSDASDSTPYGLIIVGFVLGMIYSEQLGMGTWASGFTGAVMGALLVPILKLLFKIAVFFLKLGIAIFIMYLLYQIITAE